MLAVLDRLYYVVWFGVILGNVGLGLFIGYQAYRGFRRHESGPMRYLSIGLILLTAIASTLAFGNWVAWRLEVFPESAWQIVQLLYRVVQFAGLAFIAYSLYRRP